MGEKAGLSLLPMPSVTSFAPRFRKSKILMSNPAPVRDAYAISLNGDGDHVGRVVGIVRRRVGQACQRGEHGRALTVGRELQHLVVVVLACDRRDPLAAMTGEILEGEATARGAH